MSSSTKNTCISMARPQENYAFKNTYSPITENDQEGQEYEETGSGCFRFCCFGFGRRSYLLQRSERKESWFVGKLKKLKEFSEVVAGPKWKNFVRKAGKHWNPRKPTRSTMMTNWMYSPNSYAMNFDDGADYEEDDNFLCSFSSRFSAPPVSCNQNKEDAVVDISGPVLVAPPPV